MHCNQKQKNMNTITNQSKSVSNANDTKQTGEFSKVIKFVMPAIVWVFLILTLVYFSVTNGSYFLQEILISSFIITCLLALKLLNLKK